MVVCNTRSVAWRSALLASAMLALSGCGGGGGESAAIDAANASLPPSSGGSGSGSGDGIDNQVTGSVGDGPIVGARLRVFDKSGWFMEQFSLSGADYDIRIKTQGDNYPLSLWADQGTDLVTGLTPDFRMLAIIQNPSSRTISNLNPFSTLIYTTASMSGSINDSSVAAARNTVLTNYSFGLDATVMADPVATKVSDNNIHHIVKASEALGEVVRRTRDAMLAAGAVVNGDDIINALGSDLSDGWLDGVGGPATDKRISAVANVASAAVLLETMSNQLLVNGVDAITAMDMAILQVRPGVPASSVTTNVPVTANALEQTIRSLWAAHVVQPDNRILNVVSVLETLPAGTLPDELATQLPGGIHDVLRQATTDSAYATDFTLKTVNTQASGASALPPAAPKPEPEPVPEPEPEPEPEPGPEPANSPPVIAGAPDTALLVGQAWSFTPTAQDSDGDNLNFSVLGAPGWLNFNAATGQLWGTPGDANVGSYPDIRIAASDGEATIQLPAFTLTVTAPQPVTGSASLSWQAPILHEDGSALTAINGYRIYYGRDSGNLEQIITVGGGLTSYVIDNLEQGTWYFAISAVDGTGGEGERTGLISKTIP